MLPPTLAPVRAALGCRCHRPRFALLREAAAASSPSTPAGTFARPHPLRRAVDFAGESGARPFAAPDELAATATACVRHFNCSAYRASELAATTDETAAIEEESRTDAHDTQDRNASNELNTPSEAASAEKDPSQFTKTQLRKEFRRLKAKLLKAEAQLAAAKKGNIPGHAARETKLQVTRSLENKVRKLQVSVVAAKAAAKGRPIPSTDSPKLQGFAVSPPTYLKNWDWLVKNGLYKRLAENAQRRGWLRPLTIQERVIPTVLKGYNVVASAQTGHGKTGAYVLPLLQRLMVLRAAGEFPKIRKKNLHAPKAIILTPTAELSRQIADEINVLADGFPLRAAAIFQTGQSVETQMKSAKRADIIVGTAGRILSHVVGPKCDAERIQQREESAKGHETKRRELGDEADEDTVGDDGGWRSTVKGQTNAKDVIDRTEQTVFMALGAVRFLVIDECDRLCSFEHLPDVLELFDMLPPVSNQDVTKEERLKEVAKEVQYGSALQELHKQKEDHVQGMQVVVTSATLSRAVHSRILQFAPLHQVYDMNRAMKVPSNITQIAFSVTNRKKYALLFHLLRLPKGTFASLRDAKALVFCRTAIQVNKVTEYLVKRHFCARALHGELPAASQRSVVEGFRDNRFNILVATDIATRGLDIPNIDYVVNLYVPHIPEDYLHRVGRTGRAGAPGTAITFIGKYDYKARMESHVLARLNEEENFKRIARFIGRGERTSSWLSGKTPVGADDPEDDPLQLFERSGLKRCEVPGGWMDVDDPNYKYPDVPQEVVDIRKARKSEKLAQKRKLHQEGNLGSLPSPTELKVLDYGKFTKRLQQRFARRRGLEIEKETGRRHSYLLGEKLCRARMHKEKVRLVEEGKVMAELMKARKRAAEAYASNSW